MRKFLQAIRLPILAALLAGGLALPALAAQGIAYTYDSQGRLATAVYTTATGVVTVTSSYDAGGNSASVVAQ